MKIAIVNRSDQRGGAAVVSSRLAEALRREGHEVRMLVWEKSGKDLQTLLVAGKIRKMIPFLVERLKVFMANGFDKSTLFRIDTGSDGLPLWRDPAILEADAILLNWTNQGMLSLKGLRKILSLGKKVIVTMHDMWAFSGICHHSGECRRYEKECGDCPLLGKRRGDDDLSRKVWTRKRKAYATAGVGQLVFVAVSNWLAERARSSGLLKDERVEVIPNAFDFSKIGTAVSKDAESGKSGKGDEVVILFGAARIDDPVKDHRTLVEATRILDRKYPEIAPRLHLKTFGGLKNPNALDGTGIRHTHLGTVVPEQLPGIYMEGEIVVSSSVYETLPGTLVEGAAYGAIPIAFDHGGQSDIIEEGQTGFLVPWSDNASERAEMLASAIVKAAGVSRGEGIKRRMREEAERKFGAPAVAKRYLDLLQEKKMAVNNVK